MSSGEDFSKIKLSDVGNKTANVTAITTGLASTKPCQLSVISKVEEGKSNIRRKKNSIALVSSKCSNFLDFESCAFIFSVINVRV